MFSIAIIGFGQRISNVASSLLATASGRIRLVGWADPGTPPPGVACLEGRGIAVGQGFHDVGEMLAALRPDGVLIGSPNHLHLEHIRLSLEAGCRIFSEKPVVSDLAQSEELVRLLARYGAERLQVGLVLRSSPLFHAVCQLRDSGRLGRLVSMEASENLLPDHGGFIRRDWRRYQRYSGGYLIEKCSHDFDLYNALFASRASRVASFGGCDIFVPGNRALEDGPGEKGARRYRSWPVGWKEQEADGVFASDADVLDNQLALVEYAGGGRLSFHSNTHCAWHQRRWLLAGTHGTVEGDFATGSLRFQAPYGASENIALGGSGGHYGADPAMVADLAACWLDGGDFPVPAQAAIEAGVVCLAVDEAQRSGTVVELAPWWRRLDDAATGSSAHQAVGVAP